MTDRQGLTKEQLIEYVNAALAEIKYLVTPPANYAAACGAGEAALEGVRDFLVQAADTVTPTVG